MKKNVFLLMAVAATLAGCSNDETMDVVQQEKQTIGFKTFVDKATRADVTASSLESSGFWIWADANSNASASSSLILEKDKVSYSDAKWTSETTRYWQANTKYAFTAFGPCDNYGALTYTHTVPSETDDFTTKLHGSLTYDISKSLAKTDLVYAFGARALETTPSSDDYNAVPLTFNHLLSKVTVEFTNNVGAANLRITKLKIQSAKTGTLVLKDKPTTTAGENFVWTDLQETYTTSELSVNQGTLENVGDATTPVNVIPADKSANNASVYLLPSQTTITLSFDAQIYSGSEPGQNYSHTGSATITGGLKAGHSYKLTTTLTPGNIASEPLHPIEFTVTTVNGWTDAGSVNVTVN